MKRLIIYILFLCAYVEATQAQNVSNVAFYQEGNTVVVTYSLDKTANVSLQISTDGGQTFSADLQKVSGDVGKETKAGMNRIIWDALSEREKLVGDNIIFRVLASGNFHNGHEYVDLGLPSGTLWATCNVGANTPEEYGDYFAWGEILQATHTKKRVKNNWGTYQHCNGSYDTQTKYCTDNSWGNVDNKSQLDSIDDAASVYWRGMWRIPTREEFAELLGNCIWKKIVLKDEVMGYQVIGVNGKSIFLPITRGKSNYGSYWSASLYETYQHRAYVCYFTLDDIAIDSSLRYYYNPIRPVCSLNK